MSTASNKAAVRRYFEEVVDKRNVERLDDLATPNCLVHHPDSPEPVKGRVAFKRALKEILRLYGDVHTEVHELIAEDDRVVCRYTHRAVNMGTSIGGSRARKKKGERVAWSAIAIFRFHEGRIAEQWVCSATFPDGS